jgi:hypothetical protein
MQNVWQRFVGATHRYVGTAAGKRKALVAAGVAGVMFMTAGGAFAMRAATQQFADATISKLGGDDPQAVLDSIADRVVKQLTSKAGPLSAASKQLTDKLGRLAGDKLAGIDADSLIDTVSSEVVAAGMGKLDQISTDEIVEHVTNALIEQAIAKINALDLEGLAKSTLDGAVDDLLEDVDLSKLVKEYLNSIDVEAIARAAISDQLGSRPTGLLGGLLLGR